jgi:general secretion pathway protein A
LYTDYFHFTELPFSIAPDPHFTFMSAQHKEGLAHLLYGIHHGGGFVALTGEVGTGKTTLCQCLLQQLPENVDIALILNPKMNAIELLATICDELRISYDAKQPTLKNLVDTLNQYLLSAHARGKHTVLMIDEAQNLSLKVLEQIRLLTNLETTKTKLLQIILVGQPELRDLLEKTELRQLNQRITARYHLLPLTSSETSDYVKHRLLVCKGNPELFNDKAIATIFKLSKGIPRLINVICHTALLGAYSLEQKVITPGIIKRAYKEALTFEKNKTTGPFLKPLLVGLVVTILLYTWFLWSPRQEIFPDKYAAPSNSWPVKAKKMPETLAKKIAVVNDTKPVPANPNFPGWLENPELTLKACLTHALNIWQKNVDNNERVDCDLVQKKGLTCHYDKGNWKDLITYNRPAIMEFTLTSGDKRYALLTKIKDGQPTFSFDKKYQFLLSEVLGFWDGYFLIITDTPETKPIHPGTYSEQVVWIRKHLAKFDGITTDGNNPKFFDANLKSRIIRFQQSRYLTPDGIVGAKTLLYLDDTSKNTNAPKLKER